MVKTNVVGLIIIATAFVAGVCLIDIPVLLWWLRYATW